MPRPSADFIVIGGGIVGLSIAREIKRRRADAKVVLLEKETEPGVHASGRNSGVLHAGFYYTADSLKAQFTRRGNRAWTEYCESKGLPIRRCGKLVVARSETDLPMMDELITRAKANQVPLESVTEAEARKIEPRARTHERALFSPSTSSVDPRLVVRSILNDARAEGVDVRLGVAYSGRTADGVRTREGTLSAGCVVNAAGLYADQVARDFGFSRKYRILPFKGLYLNSDEPGGSLRVHVYPVPDLRNPFLGVHATVAADGHVKIGPTAIPAFWREQYRGMENFRLGECLEIALRDLGLILFAGFDFRKLAAEELMKYSRRRMTALASELLEGIRPESYRNWGLSGIRAQLLDIENRKLEMDFVVEGDERSTHVLNAVSPGFTCSMPFAAYVCDRIKGL